MSEYRKKLIEVALPLEEINAACKADKVRTHGTIRNIHKWFAPMPLPAWRALLFAALVDNPSDDETRASLLEVIKRLVARGGDVPDASAVAEAREIIAKGFPQGLPMVLDPFCGGGSTLIEAQRLGLETLASDLNPVPVLISRTLTELLPQLRGRSPLHPKLQANAEVQLTTTAQTPLFNEGDEAHSGFVGLEADVEHYAELIRQLAYDRIGECYPQSQDETVIAWLWARTAICPSPPCGIVTLLTTSWWLDKRKGHLSWMEPVVHDGQVSIRLFLDLPNGEPPAPPKTGRGATFTCLGCGGLITDYELGRQADSGSLGLRLLAIAVETQNGRSYRLPELGDLHAAAAAIPDRRALEAISVNDGGTRRRFGCHTQADLYTPRQLLCLETFADLVSRIYDQVIEDGGTDTWATGVATLLGLGVGRLAAVGSTQSQWRLSERQHSKAEHAFTRNDLPMMWDFAETNPFGTSVGSWVRAASKGSSALPFVGDQPGTALQRDARLVQSHRPALIATDPPYFDAISYADLSDYFYVWHRKSLARVHPDLYGTIATPKQNELTAMPERHGKDREAAKEYFISGFIDAFENLKNSLSPDLPMLVVYASKEQKGGSSEETRWSSILTAMVEAGLQITGTWPIHGTGPQRMLGMQANVVASYVVMVCRPRAKTAPVCSLVEFGRALRRELPPAIADLQSAGILPVDLAQAALGPGMQIYSGFSAVVDQQGNRVRVDQALSLISQALAEVLDEQTSEMDQASRFAMMWWEKHHWDVGSFGEADQLARPLGLSMDELLRAGIVESPRAGAIRILGVSAARRLSSAEPAEGLTAWEAVHLLAQQLIDGGGTAEASALMATLGPIRESAQALVYQLHAVAVRRNWTKDQERYNALIGSWADMLAEAGRINDQGALF